MGTIATKLEYLNTTKEKIKDSINLTGANLTSEDTFRSYASKLKKGYIDIINNGINNLYNNFPKVSGIGSNLSLTPTYEAPMKLNEIQGSTLQENTPTPSSPVPIQSVTGLQNVSISNSDNTDSNTYEVNLGDIELNKIGTYQDRIYKDSGKWYVEKNIGNIASYNGETITSDYISSTGQLTTGANVIYVLATPTYTEITNTELINQLEELYTAKSQEGTTNISITSEDLEMILNVSALKGEE